MTSSVRIFAKSLHWVAAGWLIAVLWLAHAQLQHARLFDPAATYHMETLMEGIVGIVGIIGVLVLERFIS